MGQELLQMSAKERRRMIVMQQVESNGTTLVEGARRMGVSYRQAKRIWKRWQCERAGGLVHRSRGRVSNRRADERFKADVLALYQRHFWDFGPTLASEKLAELHEVDVGRETLRRWLHAAHLYVPRRAARAHRKRRQRRAQFGALVQLDGSHHEWFEQRGQSCCAMVMVDDATGATMVHIDQQETTTGAYEILRQWIERFGLPAAIYVDKKSVFHPLREPTEEEKRQGSGALTEFGKACWRLGIEIVFAHSPQAKGRVERKNGLLQDRLVKELRLRGIDEIEAANAMLPAFCNDLDERFARPADSPIDAHRRAPSAQTLNDMLCRETTRVVQNDWTVTLDKRIYQIEKQPAMPQPGQRVVLRRRLDNTLAIIHCDRPLRFRKIGLCATQKVAPPLGEGQATPLQHPSGTRGHFYWAPKGDISTVA